MNILSKQLKQSNLIFTRYLYIKYHVKQSLISAILQKKSKEALFWGYELYYSGFEEEVIQFVLQIYADYYYKGYPRIGGFLEKKINEWTKEKNDLCIGTLIQNLVYRTANLLSPPINTNTKTLFIVVSKQSIEYLQTKLPNGYLQTKLPNGYGGWKILRCVCEFDYSHEIEDQSISLKYFRENWLYYSWECPIWKKRILQYNGKQNHINQTVLFEDQDMEEEFYNKYSYEPDEQPLEIQQRCMGIKSL